MIEFTLPYPVSTNRMWRNFHGVTTLSSEGRTWKRDAKYVARAAGAYVMTGPINVAYTLHPKQTKSGKASDVRMDLGNCEKVVSDALNGLCWVDDKQLVGITLRLGEAMKDGGLSVKVWRDEESK